MIERPLVLFAQPALADKEKNMVVQVVLIDQPMIGKKFYYRLSLKDYKMHLKMVMLQ